MAANDLYEKAFLFKKTEVWKKISDAEIFAIKLPENEIGYVSVTGIGDEGIVLHIGEEAFGRFVAHLVDKEFLLNMGGFEKYEYMFQQNSLELCFVEKGELPEDRVKYINSYAKNNNIKLSGKRAYPQFVRNTPGYVSCEISEENEKEALCKALDISVLLSKLFKSVTPKEYGFSDITDDNGEKNLSDVKIPLFDMEEGELIQSGFIPCPGEYVEEYEYTIAKNVDDIDEIKMMQKQGLWDAQVLQTVEPVSNTQGGLEYFPMFLMIVESKTGYILPVTLADNSHNYKEKMLCDFAQCCRTVKLCPKKIRCRDERTYALLKDFCEKADIRIILYEGYMPILDEAKENLFQEYMNKEVNNSAYELADKILSMEDEDIKMMPKQLREDLIELIEKGVFPEGYAKALFIKLDIKNEN